MNPAWGPRVPTAKSGSRDACRHVSAAVPCCLWSGAQRTDYLTAMGREGSYKKHEQLTPECVLRKQRLFG